MKNKTNIMEIGTDLVHIPTFKKKLITPGFIEKAFTESELAKRDPEHLAGIFAAKEAYAKAIKQTPPHWLEIETTHEASGQPKIAQTNTSVSISHDGEYAIAVVAISE